jgi:transcription factor STE12
MELSHEYILYLYYCNLEYWTVLVMFLSLHTAVPHDHHDPQEYTARPGEQRRPWDNTNTHPDAANTSASASASSSQDVVPPDEIGIAEGFSYDYGYDSPGLENGLSRPLTSHEQERLAQLDRLKFFLATAPSRWDAGSSNSTGINNNNSTVTPNHLPSSSYSSNPSHPALNRFLLPTQEFVTCVLWNGLYHITGTDIVRALVFRSVDLFISVTQCIHDSLDSRLSGDQCAT